MQTPHEDPAQNPNAERGLRCRICGQTITLDRHRIRINGQHRYCLFNPSGILFEVGCFKAAPGCLFRGELTDAFSWFPGYAWRFAFCRSCSSHLGWEYRGTLGVFIGLILTELDQS